MPQQSTHTVETLTVPGTSDGVRAVADAFEAFGEAAGVPPDVRWRFLVALDEVVSNIVKYGYRGHPGVVHVTFARDESRVWVAVADMAPPFNPLDAPAVDRDAPLESRESGGLGIALMRALVDTVHYERHEDGNRLVLTRHLTATPEPSP